MKHFTYLAILFTFIAASCGTVQKVIKSSFPYTATLTIPASAKEDVSQTAVSTGGSYDQKFAKNGNNANHLTNVRVKSATLKATNPSGYNIGDIASVKIYLAKADGTDEVLVASRSDIGPNVGNSITLDIDNTSALDQHVRQPNVRIKMVYKLRKKADVDVSLHIVLDITADAAKK
jgi:hypothetical protein